jgi:tRNA1(Val) A37 N6-methylase TrmN6
MREVLRTTDLVRLSWLQALLAESRIETIVLDSHTSVLEGSINAIPRRLMVVDEDFDEAVRVLRDSGEMDAPGRENTADRLLGGRLFMHQPKDGYRAAIDPVLLAAAVPETDGWVLDAGCGTGAASLCYAYRVPQARVTGLELRADWAGIAEENLRANGMADRAAIVRGDLLQPPRDLIPDSFDEVMANPPYLPAERADMRNPPVDAPATVEGEAKLADWIGFCLAMAKPKGGITLIQRADRLDDILACLSGSAGGIVVFPLWPGPVGDQGGPDARRVVVRARKGAKTPMRLAAGLVLHDEGGAYTDAAQAVLTDGLALPL